MRSARSKNGQRARKVFLLLCSRVLIPPRCRIFAFRAAFLACHVSSSIVLSCLRYNEQQQQRASRSPPPPPPPSPTPPPSPSLLLRPPVLF